MTAPRIESLNEIRGRRMWTMDLSKRSKARLTNSTVMLGENAALAATKYTITPDGWERRACFHTHTHPLVAVFA
ncbi:hypothetical protein E1B28_001867 [Marasmius oreades]|uniref:Uncharacterized protein n=1 Tax=Marasmius oreades TaxID=181124 RepID=A0A9P7V4H0_9AGAR|nr:uncharacterized protein E1B28_001867 [Marasmius oreades]KAG7100084.1 hypothetical protein E1B28_001867 [Marasmius oreades]